MTIDEKYIVFKREQWNAFQVLTDPHPPLGLISQELKAEEIPDAVVIRKQDIFAGPALHAYASSIQTTIEILERMAPDEAVRMHDIPGFDIQHMVRLHEIRDYFFAQAMEADEIRTKKVPD